MRPEDDGLDIELQAAVPADEVPAVSVETDTLVGEPAGSPVVVVDAAVRDWMEEYARGDTTRERGGIMLGRLAQVGEEAHVTVEAVVEAVGAEERRASITFTHETWDHVNAVREAEYPHLRIVGWYHTHPGYGVFLSGYDLFIQRNFFNLPWQVAFVVDPIRGGSGFFGWRGEEIERLPGYYLQGEPAVALAAPAAVERRAGAGRCGWPGGVRRCSYGRSGRVACCSRWRRSCCFRRTITDGCGPVVRRVKPVRPAGADGGGAERNAASGSVRGDASGGIRCGDCLSAIWATRGGMPRCRSSTVFPIRNGSRREPSWPSPRQKGRGTNLERETQAMGKVNVTVIDVTGNKEQQAALPDDAPVRRIIAKLVQMMKLPAPGRTGSR